MKRTEHTAHPSAHLGSARANTRAPGRKSRNCCLNAENDQVLWGLIKALMTATLELLCVTQAFSAEEQTDHFKAFIERPPALTNLRFEIDRPWATPSHVYYGADYQANAFRLRTYSDTNEMADFKAPLQAIDVACGSDGTNEWFYQYGSLHRWMNSGIEAERGNTVEKTVRLERQALRCVLSIGTYIEAAEVRWQGDECSFKCRRGTEELAAYGSLLRQKELVTEVLINVPSTKHEAKIVYQYQECFPTLDFLPSGWTFWVRANRPNSGRDWLLQERVRIRSFQKVDAVLPLSHFGPEESLSGSRRRPDLYVSGTNLMYTDPLTGSSGVVLPKDPDAGKHARNTPRRLYLLLAVLVLLPFLVPLYRQMKH